MAELKLSTVWEIKDFADRNARIKGENEECVFKSDELFQLRHASLPGLRWYAEFRTSSRNTEWCKEGFASFYLSAYFGSLQSDTRYVWAYPATTLLDANGSDLVAAFVPDAVEFTSEEGEEKIRCWGDDGAFKLEDVENAIQKNGSLRIGIHVTVLKIGEILKCRKLLRGLLANSTHADFDVKVGEETFKLHKCVLAETSTVFSGMLQSGMEEATEGVLTLPDTTPAAFKAFSEAIYYDNWDFLSDIDLTQAVLHLAEKFDVVRLKKYCDESLVEKINETNALEILTKSVALCNAKKAMDACIEALTVNMEFKESDVWLDFKKRNRGVALEILDAVSDKCFAKFKSVEAANVDLKRKSEEEKAKPSSSKRRRK